MPAERAERVLRDRGLAERVLAERVLLDARLDGGQLWLLTEPDNGLGPARLPELHPLVGPRPRPIVRSFWVAPTGFERRLALAVDEATTLRAIIETGWPVTPALGVLAELYVAARRLVADGQVIPGPLPNFATAWTAAPDRATVARLAPVRAAAQRHHPDADDLFGYLVHHLAVETVGPVPDRLDGRAPRAPVLRWRERVVLRRAVGAHLLLRLDDPIDGFTVVPCLQARRATTVITELDADDPEHLARAAQLLQAPEPTVARLVAEEWTAAQAAWPALRDHPPGPLELEADAVVQLVERASPRLEAAGIALLLPARLGRRRTTTRRYRVSGQPSGLSVESLTLTGQVRVDGELLTPAELDALAHAQHDLVSLGGRWTYLGPGERARVAEFVRRLGSADAASVLEAAADDDAELDLELDPQSWLARALTGAWHPQPAEHVALPDLVRLPLRDYQRDGLDWLVWLERNQLGGILADDMGLGKTAMLLALVAHEHPGPTLVVAPTSVVGNWAREAERFTPGLRVVVHHGGARGDPVRSAATADIVLTTYGLLRRDERLAQVAWHRVVLDEAQAVKNSETATAKAGRALRAEHRIAATGTPVENHLEELWSIMAFASPGLLGTRAVFADQYAPTGDLEDDTERFAHLRRRIAAFVCRRTKADPGIADELPERIVVRDDCLLTGEQVALYQATAAAMLDEMDAITDTKRRRLHVFAGIAKLKQICNHPAGLVENDPGELAGRSGKLDRLVELAAEIVAEEEAVVVFSQYAGFLRRIADHLSEQLDLEVPVIHGGVARNRRDAIVDRFGAGAGPGVLAVSLRAGGTGLNLVRANHVIHFDRWWNPAVEDQASDRVWRIGQTRGVVVHTLVCPGTIEERIATLIESKRALAGSVITSTERVITALDDAELGNFVALDVDQATGR